MAKRIEEKVADTLLQTEVRITLGGKTYAVAPPTIATLAMASREIAKLPEVESEFDDNAVFKALNVAKDATGSARVVAILIMGAKAAREAENGRRKGFIFGKGKSSLDELAEELLYNATPREMMTALSSLLSTMQVGDFFAFTASLSKVNILAPTSKTAVTTASGR